MNLKQSTCAVYLFPDELNWLLFLGRLIKIFSKLVTTKFLTFLELKWVQLCTREQNKNIFYAFFVHSVKDVKYFSLKNDSHMV